MKMSRARASWTRGSVRRFRKSRAARQVDGRGRARRRKRCGNAQRPAGATARAGLTGGRQPTVKQLEAGAVLNGATRSCEDRGAGWARFIPRERPHLGTPRRAVKEMVESHLDSAQHEKASATSNASLCLLTSLEPSTRPLRLFYDEANGTLLPRHEVHLGRRLRGPLAQRSPAAH